MGFNRIYFKMKNDHWLTRNQDISEIEGILRMIGIHYGRGIELHGAITVLRIYHNEFDESLFDFIKEMNTYLSSKDLIF